MTRSIRIHEFGDASALRIEDASVLRIEDASVLRIENVAIGEPGDGEVRLRIHAIGIVPPFEILARDLTIRSVALTALTRDDAQLATLKQFVRSGLAEGALRPTVARTFPFDRIADAHRFMEAGEQVGKIVVTL